MIRVQIFKRSQKWDYLPVWRNSYLLDVPAIGDQMYVYSNALCRYEAFIHLNHVQFVYTVCNVVNQPGLTFNGDDGTTEVSDKQANRVYLPPADARHGTPESDGADEPELIFDVRQIVNSGYNQRNWYRGALCGRDINQPETHLLSLSKAALWDVGLNDTFNAYMPGGVDRLAAVNSPKVAAIYGQVENAERLQAHSALRDNKIRRARSRVSSFRKNMANAIYAGLPILADYAEIHSAMAAQGMANQGEYFRTIARHAIEQAAGLTLVGMTDAYSDRQGAPGVAPQMQTRYGLGAGAAVAAAGVFWVWKDDHAEPNPAFAEIMKAFEQPQPDEMHFADPVFSAGNAAIIYSIMHDLVYPVFSYGRIDWLTPY